jgi:HK97 gp10 family phage protein
MIFSGRPTVIAGSGLNITMEIIGGKELFAALDTLPIAVANRVERQGLKEAAKLVVDRAKMLCPVWAGVFLKSIGESRLGNTKAVPGLLRASIKAMPGIRKKGFISIVVGTAEGWFRGKTFYGGIVEFGGTRRNYPAKPFIRPAFDSQREWILNRIISSINSALVKCWMSKSGKAAA